jgi:hypothetical protein
METSLPTPMTARVELLIYQRVIVFNTCLILWIVFDRVNNLLVDQTGISED